MLQIMAEKCKEKLEWVRDRSKDGGEVGWGDSQKPRRESPGTEVSGAKCLLGGLQTPKGGTSFGQCFGGWGSTGSWVPSVFLIS